MSSAPPPHTHTHPSLAPAPPARRAPRARHRAAAAPRRRRPQRSALALAARGRRRAPALRPRCAGERHPQPTLAAAPAPSLPPIRCLFKQAPPLSRPRAPAAPPRGPRGVPLSASVERGARPRAAAPRRPPLLLRFRRLASRGGAAARATLESSTEKRPRKAPPRGKRGAGGGRRRAPPPPPPPTRARGLGAPRAPSALRTCLRVCAPRPISECRRGRRHARRRASRRAGAGPLGLWGPDDGWPNVCSASASPLQIVKGAIPATFARARRHIARRPRRARGSSTAGAAGAPPLLV